MINKQARIDIVKGRIIDDAQTLASIHKLTIEEIIAILKEIIKTLE